jgi:cysteine desulfurase
MPNLPIYLDNNATTPVDPRVLDAMFPYFTETFGNAASSGHPFGRSALKGVTAARATVAKCINAADPREIVFTSGATESDNLAIKGVADAYAEKGDHIITAPTEHKAVLDSCHRLEAEGFRVTYLTVDSCGLIDLDELRESISSDTILVSIMAGNNEIGVVHDIAGIGRICRQEGVLFHTDATQFVGKIPFDVQAMNVDLASFTAHKIYGPKGTGGLYVRRGEPEIALSAQIDGGGHEGGYRSGTLNVPGIVGLAKALEICVEEMADETARLLFLRNRLRAGIRTGLDGVYLNGHETRRLPGHLNMSFSGVEGEGLLFALQDIALSTTSACSSGSKATSHVLRALGVPDELALGAVRFGIGRFNTEDEIDYTAGRIVEEVTRQRNSPL